MRRLTVLLLAATPLAALGQTRDFRTTDRMILGTSADLTSSMVFADVDGDEDAVLANGRHWAQVNEGYLNDGQGRFQRAWEVGPEIEPTGPPSFSTWTGT